MTVLAITYIFFLIASRRFEFNARMAGEDGGDRRRCHDHDGMLK